MSMADYYGDRDEAKGIDIDLECDDLNNCLEKCLWKTKDHQYISISKMRSQHIKNCINHIDQNMKAYEELDSDFAETREAQRDQLQEELDRRSKNKRTGQADTKLRKTKQKDRRNPDGCQKDGIQINL